MHLQTTKRDSHLVIQILEPRVDAHNSDELKDYIAKLLENNEQKLIVDLSQVRFIDSSGLGALLSGYKNASLHHASLVLAGLQPRVRALFELTRLDRVFEIYADVAGALAGD
ncbi:MAG TPA: anti-sigma factor antagonist [Methylothermaceae bacterium]|nr:anti-sigma factor antagonist [Methylothermaceae bacterium]